MFYIQVGKQGILTPCQSCVADEGFIPVFLFFPLWIYGLVDLRFGLVDLFLFNLLMQ